MISPPPNRIPHDPQAAPQSPLSPQRSLIVTNEGVCIVQLPLVAAVGYVRILQLPPVAAVGYVRILQLPLVAAVGYVRILQLPLVAAVGYVRILQQPPFVASRVHKPDPMPRAEYKRPTNREAYPHSWRPSTNSPPYFPRKLPMYVHLHTHPREKYTIPCPLDRICIGRLFLVGAHSHR